MDAFKLLRRGAASVAVIAAGMGVDAGEVRRRLLQLERRKLVTFSSGNPDSVGLTVKGYNEYSPKTLETSTERKRKANAKDNVAVEAAVKETPAEKCEGALNEETKPAEAPREKSADETKETARELKETLPATQRKLAEATLESGEAEKASALDAAPQEKKIDLAELLARGAPRSRSVFIERQGRAREGKREKVEAEKPVEKPVEGKPLGGESCELCKEPFKLAVSGGNPKFGHCFCGAAYHKDCHEAVLEGEGRCVRCGRELGKVLDRKSVEALRQLKGVFE